MNTVASTVSKYMGNATKVSEIWGGVIINVKEYGAKGDGKKDDSAAIKKAIEASNDGQSNTIVFPLGTYKISSNIVIPQNVNIWIMAGAKLSPDSGVYITINGEISAGEHQIFTGNGTIIGRPLNSLIYAEWFGLPPHDGTDACPALQKAVNYAQLNDIPLMIPRGRRIRLDSQLIILKGKNAASDVSMGLTIYWNDAIVLPNLNDYGIFVQPLCTNANAGNGWAIANVNWYDVTFSNYYGNFNNYPLCRAFQLGEDGYAFDGFKQSVFKNILISGFNNGHSYLLNHVRFVNMEKVFTRDGAGVRIQCNTDGEFCGDLSFVDCEFSGTEANSPLTITAYSAGASSEIRGIRFSNCVTYGSGTRISAAGSAKVGDLWFDNCAWDSGTTDAIIIYGNGTTTLFNILFSNIYIVSYSGVSNGVWLLTDGSSVTTSNIAFNGGEIGFIGSYGFLISNFNNFSIRDIAFGNIGGITAISVDNSKGFQIQNNIIESGSALTSMILIGSVACNNYIVTGNIGKKAVSDLGSTNKVVANNLVLV